MKFLFLTIDGLSLDIAFRVQAEGHEVIMYIKNPPSQDVGDGIVPKTDDWEGKVAWADVIVIDDVGLGRVADRLRETGKPVFGGSEWGDQIENERKVGMDVAKNAGLLVPPYHEFTNIPDGIRFIQENKKPWVFKPYGQLKRNLVHVGEAGDGSDVAWFMENLLVTKAMKDEHSYVLQEKVEGVEVGVAAYCDGARLYPTKQCNFEHKRLLNGDLGPNTGETGTLLYHRKAPQKLFDLTLNNMEKTLVDQKYVGWIDANCIVNKQGAWFLEWTARWGYPQMLITLGAMKMPMGKLIHGVATSTLRDWEVSEDFCTGVVVYSEGFPFKEAYKVYGKGRLIKGVTKSNLKNIHFGEVKMEGERMITAGSDGWTLIVTGVGETIDDSIKKCYGNARTIEFPGMGYRTDIGADSQERYDRLVAMGYLEARVEDPNEWKGVDLDSTLSKSDHEEIGVPVRRMMERVKTWLAAGKKVKILTERAGSPEGILKVKAWLKEHGLPDLEVTNEMDRTMTEIWDDRAQGVVADTGEKRQY